MKNSRIGAAAIIVALSFTAVPAMAQTPPAYVGQLMTFSGNYCPYGWLPTDGSLQPIGSYPTLFNVIGITYGGDGASTFGLPKVTVPKTLRNVNILPVKLSECIAYLGIFPSKN